LKVGCSFLIQLAQLTNGTLPPLALKLPMHLYKLSLWFTSL